MNKFTVWILALCAVTCLADLEQDLAGLTGTAGDGMPSSRAIAAYPSALDHLLTRLAGDDTGAATAARNTLTALAMRAGRPGAETERAALCRAIAARFEADAPRIVRADLLELLQKIGRDESVPVLTDLLREDDSVLAEKARQALAANPAPAATVALREALAGTGDPRLKAGLIYALGLRGDETSVPAIANALRGDDEALALIATKALAAIGTERVARGLVQERAEASPAVRSAIDDACLDIAVAWIEEGASERAASLLRTIARTDASPRVRAVATYGLIRAEPDQAAARVVGALADDDAAVRTAALDAARTIGGETLAPALAEALPDLAAPAQVAVINLLGEMSFRPAGPSVTARLTSEDEGVQLAAARALGVIGDGGSVAPLLGKAETGRGEVKKEAERALAALDADGVNEALRAAANDGTGKRRAAAIRIRAERDREQAGSWLVDYVAAEDKEVYRAALRALQDHGTSAQVPVMVDLLVAEASGSKASVYQRTLKAMLARERDPSARGRAVIAGLDGADEAAAVVLVGLLPSIGSPVALDQTRQALRAGSPGRQEAAVRALAAWPAFDAAQDLLAVVTDVEMDQKLRLLAAKGLARLSNEATDVPLEKRLDAVSTALQSADRTDARVALIAALGQVPDRRAIEALTPFLVDEGAGTETAMALVQISKVLRERDPATAEATAQKVLGSAAANELIRTEASTLLDEIGADRYAYLTEWDVAGPYQGENLFEQTFAPEQDPENVTWKRLDQRVVDGNVLRFLRVPEWALKNRVVYLSQTVTWPKAGAAILELGSDDGAKIWLNGEQVFAKDARRPHRLGQDRIPLEMKRGENDLMVKLVQYGGQWELSVRIVPEGTPPPAEAEVRAASAPRRKEDPRKIDFDRFPMARPGWYRSTAKGGDRVKVLLLTGRMNKHHRWEETTPYLKQVLEATGRFAVDVHTMPPEGADLADWHPRFEDYPAVLMNVDGGYWPENTQRRFEDLVRAGRLGVVVVHSTSNAWKDWGEWNEMTAVGGWGGRNPSSGPWIRWRDGKMVLEQKDGPSGSHGPRHAFVIDHRSPDHPVTDGLPEQWIHHVDELYACLRGPAKRVTLLGTAYSDPEKPAGTGEHEPMLMAIGFGQGRIFHTTLGHDVESMRCAGFQATLARGTEWAATGKVTLPKPSDFPTATEPSVRAGVM